MKDEGEIWTTLKILTWTKEYLAGKGVANARLETEWLLCEALSLDRVGLYLNFDKPLEESELLAYRSMVARRAKREPLQHILGSQEFMGLEFRTTSAALIPRHDTAVLVAAALQVAPAAAKVLDIGSGSGCVAITLAKNIPGAVVVSVDISSAALDLARRNAELNTVSVDFRQGSLFKAVQGERFDLIVSNPPYIPAAEIDTLEPEVSMFEPRVALDGGADGLDFFRQIIPAAPEYLHPDGWLLVEVGAGQSGAVTELFAKQGFSALFSVKDPGGIDRIVAGQLKK